MAVTVCKLPALRHAFTQPKLISTSISRAMASSTSTSTSLTRRLPQETWDSHMHIVEPENFPLASDAQYKPHPHTLSQAHSFYAPFGIKNMVIVQPSIYGNDNSCTLAALEAIRASGDGKGRAVVQFDPNTIDGKTMQMWHKLGVRGVRVNLVSVGRNASANELRQELQNYAKVLKPFGWVLELFIHLKALKDLEGIISELGVKVVVAHFGYPTLPAFNPEARSDPYDLPGFESMVRLASKNKNQFWVKLSAPYRITKDPNFQDGEMRDVDGIGKELVKECPDKIVWASDWPHTRFDGEEKRAGIFIERCLEWCGNDEDKVEKLFKTNAEELWDLR